MTETILYFALGALTTILLVLMMAPAVWRRAIAITRERIEASVPLTLSEIQADRDQLRAEFAMSTRRLEMSLEALRTKASEQLIEVNRKRDELARLAEEHAEKISVIADTERRVAELEAELSERQSTLENTHEKLETAQAELEASAHRLEQYETALRSAAADVDSHKLELVDRETRLTSATDTVRAERERLKAARDEAGEATAKARRMEADLAKERARSTRLDSAVERLQASLADKETQLERRTADLQRLRSNMSPDEANAALQKRADELEAENVRLEGELAESLRRTGAVLESASSQSIQGALGALREEKGTLEAENDALQSELQALKIELSAAQLSAGEAWDADRQATAMVRERINDLAARVTLVAREIEGDASPIDRIIAETKLPENVPTEGERPVSLADRVRALQAMAEEGR